MCSLVGVRAARDSDEMKREDDSSRFLFSGGEDGEVEVAEALGVVPDDFDAGDHEPELAVMVLNIGMIKMFNRLNITRRRGRGSG